MPQGDMKPISCKYATNRAKTATKAQPEQVFAERSSANRVLLESTAFQA
jgi:hypothetical protein